MLRPLSLDEWALAFAIGVGATCWVCALICALSFNFRRSRKPLPPLAELPGVTLLKPVYGLEKRLRENLRTACEQDYPNYQVVYSVQRRDDPAIPLLLELEKEFGSARVSVAIESVRVGLNGKVNNLAGALPHARHELLVISDSDVNLDPGFLRQIVAPFADAKVGIVSTFFRAVDAEHWYEQLEQLTLNGDQLAMALLASATSSVDFCFGASTALTKQTLAQLGGFEALGEHLVEDYEMGRRTALLGKRVVVIPHIVRTTVDLAGPLAWWRKQTYWDQNTLAAVPALFVGSLLLRIVPLSLLFAGLRGFDSVGLGVLGGALVVRLSAVAAVVGVALADLRGLRALWLVPIKDLVSLGCSLQALLSRKVVWRGVELSLTRNGRLSHGGSSVIETERLP
jgi:ceramide glucosyltransferase